MKMPVNGQRGVFLVHAMVLILLLTLMVSLLLQLSFSRSMTVNHVLSTETKRFLAQAVESQVQGCLQESLLGSSGCSPSGAEQACFPASVDFNGQPVRVQVSFSGIPPACVLRIDVLD